MAYRVTTRAQSMSASQTLSQKLGDDPVSNKNAQSTVTCVYQTHIGEYWRNVTILWSKNLMNHSLNISVDSVETDFHHSCKIDLKPWHFWAKKGYKTFDVDGLQVDAYWDLRSAKFSGGPEPCTDFYVALVCEEEVVLLLGDLKKKAYKRTKSRPALVEAVLFYKKEHVFGKKCFSTRAKFDHRKKENEIVVESSTSGPRDPEMWISIDGIVMIHIRNLQWKFRGNQTVIVNKQPVQVFGMCMLGCFAAQDLAMGCLYSSPEHQTRTVTKRTAAKVVMTVIAAGEAEEAGITRHKAIQNPHSSAFFFMHGRLNKSLLICNQSWLEAMGDSIDFVEIND